MDSCWALCYISEGLIQIQPLIELGICHRIAELLLHTEFKIQLAALRTVGNIVTGNENQTQVMIDANVLQCLKPLLLSPHLQIRRETCWTLSNITAGSKSQIQAIIDSKIIINLINLAKEGDFEIMKEAGWALINALTGGTIVQIKYIISLNCIPSICSLLHIKDYHLISSALDTMELILKLGEIELNESGENPYLVHVEKCKGLEILESLQYSDSDAIYKKSVHILQYYFKAEETTDDTVPPNINFKF